MTLADDGSPGTPGRTRSSPASPDTHGRILLTAAKLFAARGYHATGIAEIGRAVGLGTGALYHHIGSKQELLLAICRPPAVELLAVAEEMLSTSDLSPLTRMHRLARTHMHLVATNPTALKVTLREIDSFSGARHVEMRAVRERTETIWAQLLREAVAAHEVGDIDPLAVKTLLGALNYAVLWYRPTGGSDAHDVADRVVAMVCPRAATPCAAAPGSGTTGRA